MKGKIKGSVWSYQVFLSLCIKRPGSSRFLADVEHTSVLRFLFSLVSQGFLEKKKSATLKTFLS